MPNRCLLTKIMDNEASRAYIEKNRQAETKNVNRLGYWKMLLNSSKEQKFLTVPKIC